MNLETRYNHLVKSGLTVISRKLKGRYCEEKDKLVKDDKINAFSRKGLTLNSCFDSRLNALVVLTGERYGRVICVDIDPKGDTLELFTKLSENFPEVWDGLWELSMNGGWHFYFKVADEQLETLKNLRGSNGSPETKQGLWWDLGLHADVKYNEMVVTSCGYFRADGKTWKSDICSWSRLTPLPDAIFCDIVKYCVKAERPEISKDPEEYREEIKSYQITEKYEEIKPYIDLLKPERFSGYDAFFRIMQIVNNCGGNKEDMLEIARTKGTQSRIEDVEKDYNGLKLGKGCKMGTLLWFAKTDNPEGFKALKKSSVSELEKILVGGYSDVACRKAFKEYYGKKLIFRGGKKPWYIMDDYGIFHFDECNAELRDMIIGLDKPIGELTEKCSNEMSLLEKPTKKIGKTETPNEKKLKSLGQFSKSINSKKGLADVASVLEPDYIVKDFLIKADYQNIYAIGFNNGVYDLQTGEFRNAKHDEYITKTTGYDYGEENSEMIDYIMGLLRQIYNSEEEIEFILRIMCLSLVGCNKHEKIFFHLGNGRNGKGVLQCMMQHTLGNYYGILPYNYFTNSKYANASAADPNLAQAFGVRHMTIDEGDVDTSGLNVSNLKLHSGNTPISVRDLYDSKAELIVSYKMHFFINREPNIVVKDDDDAIRERCILIRYQNTFKDSKNIDPENKFHREKIENLKEDIIPKDGFKLAFFHVLLRAYKNYVKDGKKLVLPPRIAKDTLAFLDKNDDLSTFLGENYEITKNQNDRIGFEVFFTKYDKYLKDMGRNPETRTVVISKLAKLNVALVKNCSKRDFAFIKPVFLEPEEE